MNNDDRASATRRAVATISFLSAFGVLVVGLAEGDIGTLFEWPEIRSLSWLALRVGFLFLAAVQLWEADQKIDALQRTRGYLERIIGELQSHPHAPKGT